MSICEKIPFSVRGADLCAKVIVYFMRCLKISIILKDHSFGNAILVVLIRIRFGEIKGDMCYVIVGFSVAWCFVYQKIFEKESFVPYNISVIVVVWFGRINGEAG